MHQQSCWREIPIGRGCLETLLLFAMAVDKRKKTPIQLSIPACSLLLYFVRRSSRCILVLQARFWGWTWSITYTQFDGTSCRGVIHRRRLWVQQLLSSKEKNSHMTCYENTIKDRFQTAVRSMVFLFG
jgi:hypothetical protein